MTDELFDRFRDLGLPEGYERIASGTVTVTAKTFKGPDPKVKPKPKQPRKKPKR